MPSLGFLQIRVYTSFARLPLEEAAVTVTDAGRNLLAIRFTDSSGLLPAPLSLPVPDIEAGQEPDTGTVPCSLISIHVQKEGYLPVFAENIQIFPGILTMQNLELIPLSESPDYEEESEHFDTPPQNL